MISQETVNQIFELSDIVEVIQEFVQLKRQGSSYIGCCPFHDEKTPSFSVSSTKSIYKCFSCGAGGTVANFLMEHEKMNYPEALKWLASKYNIEVKEDGKKASPENEKLRENLFAINNFAVDYFTSLFTKKAPGKKALLHLQEERGYTEKTINHFQLGYSLDSFDSFKTEARHFDIENLKKSGLVANSKGRDFDFYRNRLMIPIHDLSGKIIGFAGRIFPGAAKSSKTTDRKPPKYLNPTDTYIYRKEKVLYGLYFAAKHIRSEDNCIIVEGYTDVISMHQSGICNTVATCGTALTPEQAKLIKRFTDNVTFLFDGDAAGIKASLKNIDILLEHGLNIQVVTLPEDHDPDSFSRTHDAFGLKAYIEEATEDFIFFKSRLLMEGTDRNPIKKADAINDIVDTLAKINDQAKTAIYIDEVCKLFDISKRIISSKLKDKRNGTQLSLDSEFEDEIVVSYDEVKHYKRVGCDYFKTVFIPNRHGEYEQLEKKWSKAEIKEDYVKKGLTSFIDRIPRFDAFCNIPDYSESYLRIHKTRTGKTYNLANPLTWELKPGDFSTTVKFLKHLFNNGNAESSEIKEFEGDAFTIALDYLTLLFRHPTQILPLPCLVSADQGTGKTTFLKWLKDIFLTNCVVLGNEQFQMPFNSHYITKHIICIDESFIELDKKSEKEKIKKMATDDRAYLHIKGVDAQEVDYHGKLIMVSNDENNFIRLEDSDVRFWVNKVHRFNKEVPDMRQRLKHEIPGWLYYLKHREIVHEQDTRAWFKYEYLVTEQMKKVVKTTRTRLEKDLIYFIKDMILLYEMSVFKCPLELLVEELNKHAKWRHSKSDVREYLLNKKNMKPSAKAKRYDFPTGFDEMNNDKPQFESKIGKVYEFRYEDWIEEDDFPTEEEKEAHRKEMQAIKDDLPF